MSRQDLCIMKVVASAVTWILPSLKWLSLVDCVEDFRQLMEAQVYFYFYNFSLSMCKIIVEVFLLICTCASLQHVPTV
jgi:hypothetical protein